MGRCNCNYKITIGTLPEIISSDIASDDSYLDIYFSEGMYTEATTVVLSLNLILKYVTQMVVLQLE